MPGEHRVTTVIRMKGTRENPAPVKPGGILTIGNFDGVHTGHQAMLKAGQEFARARHAAFTLLTFEPHPAAILRPDRAPAVLTPLEWKLHLLEQFEPSSILVLEDSASLLALTAEEFVGQFLVPTVGPSVIVEGEDFRFGSGRGGTVDSLRDLGARMGFEVKVVPSKAITLGSGQTMKVSSTSIRGMLGAGQAADASLALGRPYRLLGEIVAGRGKGRQIGFPTLNMGKTIQLVPAEGVYACWVGIADSCQGLFQGRGPLDAVLSVGRARTFGDDLPLLIEAHVLWGTVHARPGQWMSMDLVAGLRRQQKFTRVEDLVRQIREDCSQAKEILQKGAERRV
jgi:riboflavin kinase / FMN adenylyltransferase